MKKKQVLLICFQILGRYFPNESENDSPLLRKALKLSSEQEIQNSEWKAAASVWLSENITLKK